MAGTADLLTNTLNEHVRTALGCGNVADLRRGVTKFAGFSIRRRVRVRLEVLLRPYCVIHTATTCAIQ